MHQSKKTEESTTCREEIRDTQWQRDSWRMFTDQRVRFYITLK